MNEALDATAPELPFVSMTALTPTSLTEPTKAELLAEQSRDQLYRELASLVGTPASNYQLLLQSQCVPDLRYPIDETVQNVVPLSPQVHVLHLYHYLPLVRHPAECNMYDTVLHEV